jgi:hypothetical protein
LVERRFEVGGGGVMICGNSAIRRDIIISSWFFGEVLVCKTWWVRSGCGSRDRERLLPRGVIDIDVDQLAVRYRDFAICHLVLHVLVVIVVHVYLHILLRKVGRKRVGKLYRVDILLHDRFGLRPGFWRGHGGVHVDVRVSGVVEHRRIE